MDTEQLAGIDRQARESGFSGVIRVDREGQSLLDAAYGLAHRGLVIPNRVDTRFQIASGAKGFTALAIASLIDQGRLALDTTARSVLGDDLPLIADDVTIEHLLAHRSGIGDYLDEAAGHAVTDYVMPVPVHELASVESYLPSLDGKPTAFPADERFAYCNSGYVVLSIVAERIDGAPFHELVSQRVCAPAGLTDTAFLRGDESHERVAEHYLDAAGRRTNVLHLPVRGAGDGGLTSTAADVHALWQALFAGKIVSQPLVDELIRARTADADDGQGYGLGFWLPQPGRTVALEGYDAGVSFRSVHSLDLDLTFSVLANTSNGAWPLARDLQQLFYAAR